MVEGERKTGSAFSWADEVEREEEEARVGNCEGKRSNPFGSARPREVVLQEKGIDWRKLDQDLHHSSNIRYEAAAEKPRKENNPAFSARAGNKNQKSKPETRDLGFGSRGISGGFMIPQRPMGAVFVAPPGRYPTRNVLACLPEELYSYRSSHLLDSEDAKFRHRNRIDFLHKHGNDAARERMLHEPQRRQFYNSGGLGLGIEGRIHHYDDRFVGREGEYPECHVNGRRYSEVGLRRPWMMEPPHFVGNFGESVACDERRAYADYNRSPLLKRPPSIVDHHRARNGGIGTKLMNQPYNGTAQHGQWPRQPLHNNSGCRMMNSARREMCLEKEKEQLADDSMEEAVADGRTAELQCSVKKKGADSVRTGRKRSMKSAPESNHLHGKRR